MIPTPALAREYYYFHKSGVSREDFKKDRQECDALASGVRKRDNLGYVPPNPNLTVGQNAAAAGIAALFSGMISAGERRRTMSMVERICMADKGYQRYEVQPVIVRDIEKLPSKEAQLDRHFEMAASVEPVGKRIVE
tara:strand:- start:2021 stop:2431 length:411 start_codon:yes stop_codon:yes gene_type:complete